MTEKTDKPMGLKVTELFKTEKQINSAMTVGEKNGMTLQKQYHVIAASILVHLAKNKDIRMVRRMIEKFPEALRANAMLAYLEKYGQVRVLTEGDTLKAFKGMKKGDIVYDENKTLKLADALENPWYKAAKEPAYKPIDLDAMISNVIRLADARLKKGTSAESGDHIDKNKLEQLRKLVSAK